MTELATPPPVESKTPPSDGAFFVMVRSLDCALVLDVVWRELQKLVAVYAPAYLLIGLPRLTS